MSRYANNSICDVIISHVISCRKNDIDSVQMQLLKKAEDDIRDDDAHSAEVGSILKNFVLFIRGIITGNMADVTSYVILKIFCFGRWESGMTGSQSRKILAD